MGLFTNIIGWFTQFSAPRGQAEQSPTPNPVSRLVENLAGTLSGALTLTKVVVPVALLIWAILEGVRAFTTSVVVMPLTVSPELTQQGVTSAVIVERILDRMENIRRDAQQLAPMDTGAWDNIPGLRSANDFNRQIPELGESAGILAEALHMLGIGNAIVTGEVLCPPDDKQCSLDRAVFHLRTMDKSGRHPVIANGDGPAKAASFDGRLEIVAHGLLERLNPMLFAATIYGRDDIPPESLGRVRDAMDAALHGKSLSEQATIHRQLAALMLGKHPDQALVQFQLALDIDPEDVNALDGIAQAHAAFKRYQHAADAYNRAIPIAERNSAFKSLLPTLYLNRGIVLYKWEEVGAAQSDFQRSQALDAPLGADDQAKKRMEDAQTDFRHAQTLGDSGASIARAYSAIEQGKYDEAQQAFDRAAELKKADDRVRFAADFGRGIALFQQGQDFKEAAKAFERASYRNPDYLYPGLWISIALTRQAGHIVAPTDDDQPAASKAVPPWPAPILAHLSGKVSEKQLLDLAAAPGDPNNKPDAKLCEAHFYLGQIALALSQIPVAQQHFRAAQATPLPNVLEYRLAKLQYTSLESRAR